MIASALLGMALATSGAFAAEDDFEFELDGYYRVRGYTFGGLYDQKSPARFMSQRLRVQPGINFEDRAKFFFMADVLDDVVWGDNQSDASTSLFAGNPSSNNFEGVPEDTFQIKRAWMEFKVPVGLVRVGRQPSNWGMGLLANAGDGFDDLFGENHGGSTYDRVLFATRPIAIGQAIAGKDDTEIPFFLGVGVDRLVEDPLFQYYGYECNQKDATDTIIAADHGDYDKRCDPDGDGYHTVEHSYVDEDRLPENRQQDWTADPKDDVYEIIYLAIYKGEDVDFAGSAMDLTVGGYMVNRVQGETNSNVLIWDAYVNFLWQGIYLEGEVLHIGGKTEAIALQGTVNSDGGSPLYKEADIWGYVGRAGYKKKMYTAMFETGFASGDNNVADADFTGRPIHPDFNVGLILYDEILARATAYTWTDGARGLWSNGGVYNSRYIFPTLSYRPMDKWEVIGGYLLAWPHKPDGAIIQCAEGDKAGGEKIECPAYNASAKELGWEVDLALKHTFHNHILFSVEGGYAAVSDRIDMAAIDLDPDGKVWTVQTRIAYDF